MRCSITLRLAVVYIAMAVCATYVDRRTLVLSPDLQECVRCCYDTLLLSSLRTVGSLKEKQYSRGDVRAKIRV
eukprot:832381-Prorocentrum_minimum.AAC.2